MLGSILFVALNLADAWLTKQAVALGGTELNPVAQHFGYCDDLLLKGLLAGGVALVLLGIRKSHLFWYLNIAMLIVVVWNTTVVAVGNIL